MFNPQAFNRKQNPRDVYTNTSGFSNLEALQITQYAGEVLARDTATALMKYNWAWNLADIHSSHNMQLYAGLLYSFCPYISSAWKTTISGLSIIVSESKSGGPRSRWDDLIEADILVAHDFQTASPADLRMFHAIQNERRRTQGSVTIYEMSNEDLRLRANHSIARHLRDLTIHTEDKLEVTRAYLERRGIDSFDSVIPGTEEEEQ